MTPAPDASRIPDTDCPTETAAMPEHVVVLLLEAGERFLHKMEASIEASDPLMTDYCSRKIQGVITELHRRLNHQQGGELVGNLVRLYGWWQSQVLFAVDTRDIQRLRQVRTQMDEIRQAWEHVLFRGEGMSEGPIS